ncbi:MAG TPA: choice-of-anchor B family protein [Dehalococcoidia bacterium]|nr:choice-of-anchor B family protein [Dehalococcoidia bacterium]
MIRTFRMFPLVAVLLVAVAALPSLADEDSAKLKGLLPAYRGPGITGRPLSPGEARERGFNVHNMALQSWITLPEFPGAPDFGSNVWGYTSPGGREYALMGLKNGVAFVDITDPVNPVVVGHVAGNSSLWRDAKTIGQYAYIASEGGRGIQVVDLRSIDAGVITHVKDKFSAGHSTTHTLISNPASGYLYLCGANIGAGGLVAVSTADPVNPTVVGAWTSRYVHEAVVTTYDSGPFAGREIAYAFTGAYGVHVIDVTNKAAMTTIASITYPGVRFCHQGWLTQDKAYLYADDEFDEIKSFDETATHVFDVRNPAAPVYLGYFTNGWPSSDHNLYVHGTRVYESNYRGGLHVFDCSDPAAPEHIAFFDTHPESDNSGFNGSWGNYPFFASGSIAVSDMQRGLFILRLQPECRVDLNGDGEVNSLDFIAFLNDFNDAGPNADWNADGSVNTLDVVAFLNDFDAGCS